MGYLRRRLTQAVITMYSVITLGFFFTYMMPGGPEEFLRRELRENPRRYGISQPVTQGKIERYLEANLITPPDKPIHEQFINYLINIHQGDLGISYVFETGTPVVELIAARAPWTILLSSIGIVWGLVITIILGALMAYYEGTKFDTGITVTQLVSSAVPYYIAAILLLYFAGFQLGWFPIGGRYNSEVTVGYNLAFIRSVFYHAALPSLSFILTGFAGGALGFRAHAVRILGEDYIRVAELRGISTYKLATAYIARNSMLPMWTGIMIGISGLLGGSVIMETIFAYEGMGELMFQATIQRDFPILTAGLALYTLLFVIGTLLADFTYSLIDPRAEQASMG